MNDGASGRELDRITRELERALATFQADARIADLAQKEMPDARARLEHVLRMTDAAAHRTLDLVEQACPLVAGVASEAARRLDAAASGSASPREVESEFLARTKRDLDGVRANLSEVLLAQGYQDLTGQIIRSVIRLVTEVEATLVGLLRLTGRELAGTAPRGDPAARADLAHAEGAAALRRGVGPTVPGVDREPGVSGQGDVDDLLSRLGV